MKYNYIGQDLSSLYLHVKSELVLCNIKDNVIFYLK